MFSYATLASLADNLSQEFPRNLKHLGNIKWSELARQNLSAGHNPPKTSAAKRPPHCPKCDARNPCQTHKQRLPNFPATAPPETRQKSLNFQDGTEPWQFECGRGHLINFKRSEPARQNLSAGHNPPKTSAAKRPPHCPKCDARDPCQSKDKVCQVFRPQLPQKPDRHHWTSRTAPSLGAGRADRLHAVERGPKMVLRHSNVKNTYNNDVFVEDQCLDDWVTLWK